MVPWRLTPPVDFAERIAVGDGVALSRPRCDTAAGVFVRGQSLLQKVMLFLVAALRNGSPVRLTSNPG